MYYSPLLTWKNIQGLDEKYLHNTRDELICVIGRSIRNIKKDGRDDDVRFPPNISQNVINMSETVLKIPVSESSTQWDKDFMPYKEFDYNIYIDGTLIWCYYETFETQRLISRSLVCVEWRNNGLWWAKVIGSVPL